MRGYALEAMGMVNALGADPSQIYDRLLAGDTGSLVEHQLITTGMVVPVGRFGETLPDLPEQLRPYQCRNHALAWLAFQQIADRVAEAVVRYGPSRVGVVVGSSTSGIDASEAAFFHWAKNDDLPDAYQYETQHEMGSVASLLARGAGLQGPAYTVSTACSSSAKVFASARGLLDIDACDAVVVGGVDALCHLTLNGFESLGALARQISLPMSRNRTGLNIGEGASFMLLSRGPGRVRLYGVGESGDAHHMSAPHPEGIGAEKAMRLALADAALDPEDIGYLNLHGTGTALNDAMEAKAVHAIFSDLACGSTKPLVGHCLGAAGAIEVGFCWLILHNAAERSVALPPHCWDGETDERIPGLDLVDREMLRPHDGSFYTMSNSFAFGGNNCSVIIGLA